MMNNLKITFFNQLVAAPHDSFPTYSPHFCVSILHSSRSYVIVNCLKLVLCLRHAELKPQHRGERS